MATTQVCSICKKNYHDTTTCPHCYEMYLNDFETQRVLEQYKGMFMVSYISFDHYLKLMKISKDLEEGAITKESAREKRDEVKQLIKENDRKRKEALKTQNNLEHSLRSGLEGLLDL